MFKSFLQILKVVVYAIIMISIGLFFKIMEGKK